MCEDSFARIVIKQGNGIPTIPASADHRNGDWTETDIYEGEFYQDLDTGLIYNRFVNTIILSTGVPATLVVILDKAQVNGMNATPVVLLTAPAGYAVRFTKKPVLKTFSDGSNWTFASGETVDIYNTSAIPIMLQFSDPCVTTDGVYAGADFFTYELVTGDVSVTSSISIGGGGTDGTFTFYLDYELFLL